MHWPTVVFGVAAVLCAIGHVAILRSVIRVRARVPDPSAPPNVPRPRFGVELVWAVLPALALAWVLAATYARVRESAAGHPSAAAAAAAHEAR